MSIAGGHDKAARAAAALGMNALQVFTKSNNQWKAKPLTDDQIAAFRQATAEMGLTDPVAHDSYLINLASPDDVLWHKSIDAMTVELERAEALGIVALVSHPGAHVGSGEEAGIARVAAALDEVHRRTAGVRCQITLETTAGQGSCLGHRFEHLRAILDRVTDPDRLGICLDSCHIFAAGYRLRTDSEYNETIGELDRIVGLGRVRAWHLNDSAKGCGSRVDRHAGIGRGELGLGPFARIVADPRFAALPMILETPKGTEGGENLDAINLRLLRQLEASAEAAAAGGASRAARAS
ncbi:deoxyribonuclease IV [Tautonia sociabilis]|uniref:Probable endonuclease 4 n=2 Tax=Tautonia sociabilis TaxID=2080755 RepID=A0A432MJI6_9BACT|nr:deoxyribonuclease IV [Tautonia sociabilis]